MEQQRLPLKNLIFNIDWGETIGFSVISLDGQLILTGSTKDRELVINVYYSLLPNIHTLCFEDFNQYGGNEYSEIIRRAVRLSEEFEPSIGIIKPGVWKYSPAIKLKRTLSKHEIESYRQSMYVLGKFQNT